MPPRVKRDMADVRSPRAYLCQAVNLAQEKPPLLANKEIMAEIMAEIWSLTDHTERHFTKALCSKDRGQTLRCLSFLPTD